MQMTWLGLFGLIIEGGPQPTAAGKSWLLTVTALAWRTAGDLAGLDLKSTLAGACAERFHDKIAVSAIGTAGERLYRTAGITHIDNDRHLTRISARGGLGAVMGSKRLKAIIFDQPQQPAAGHRRPDAVQGCFPALSPGAAGAPPDQRQVYPVYGTAGMVQLCNSLGGIPTRNFSAGQFEDADAISGETIHDLNKGRGGDTTHACMAGCIIKCSNIYARAGRPGAGHAASSMRPSA
jgi:aldehyde:ferredoxin oxidoreductase